MSVCEYLIYLFVEIFFPEKCVIVYLYFEKPRKNNVLRSYTLKLKVRAYKL